MAQSRSQSANDGAGVVFGCQAERGDGFKGCCRLGGFATSAAEAGHTVVTLAAARGFGEAEGRSKQRSAKLIGQRGVAARQLAAWPAR
jgi:hypothetical protein